MLRRKPQLLSLLNPLRARREPKRNFRHYPKALSSQLSPNKSNRGHRGLVGFENHDRHILSMVETKLRVVLIGDVSPKWIYTTITSTNTGGVLAGSFN
jgi:hypothetical protein